LDYFVESDSIRSVALNVDETDFRILNIRQ